MAILVTGGLGYIGAHTCVELEKAGFEIIVVDNLYNSKITVCDRIKKLGGRHFKFYGYDVCNEKQMDEVFKGNPIEAVIHFAGYKAVGESVEKPLEYYENNVGGTMNILRQMKKYNIRAIVFSSSATVYGSDNESPLTEDMPVGNVTNPYGRTKYINECMLKDYCDSDEKFSACLLRYFNPIGAHESGIIGEAPNGIPNNLMPYITNVAVGKLPRLNVFGNDYPTPDGTGVRDYIHVVDLARGHVAALRKVLKDKGCHIYNLGTGTGYSVIDIIETFESVNEVEIPYRFHPRRAGDIAVCYSNPEKAYKELGWKAERNLEDMCRDSWNWQKNNPDGYPDEDNSLAGWNGWDYKIKELNAEKKTKKKRLTKKEQSEQRLKDYEEERQARRRGHTGKY